jgi:dynein heavy chain
MVLVNQIVTSVEPKVMEPYDPIPGRVPRKVAIERKRKEFKNISLEEVLQSLVFKK